jgi:cell division protein FtsZ
MDEVSQITEYLQDMIGDTADMIWGVGKDDSLGKQVNVTVIATGFHTDNFSELSAIMPSRRKEEKEEEKHVGKTEQASASKEKKKEEKVVIKDKNKPPVPPPDPEEEKRRRKRFRKFQEMGYGGESAEQLDELENEPAYKRRNFDPTDKSGDKDQEFSNITVGKDKDNQLRLGEDNSFFHDNVD